MNAKVVRDILNDSLGENQVLWRGCFLKKIPPPKMTIVMTNDCKKKNPPDALASVTLQLWCFIFLINHDESSSRRTKLSW